MQQTYKYMERDSASLVLREIQIKTTGRHHFIATEIAKSKKTIPKVGRMWNNQTNKPRSVGYDDGVRLSSRREELLIGQQGWESKTWYRLNGASAKYISYCTSPLAQVWKQIKLIDGDRNQNDDFFQGGNKGNWLEGGKREFAGAIKMFYTFIKVVTWVYILGRTYRTVCLRFINFTSKTKPHVTQKNNITNIVFLQSFLKILLLIWYPNKIIFILNSSEPLILLFICSMLCLYKEK